uniref:Uncharacterized protein n=1 Tax=Heterorhabditis bacteriophora TaxID=37862 RepID=A0A1I7WIM0_HETBA
MSHQKLHIRHWENYVEACKSHSLCTRERCCVPQYLQVLVSTF